MARTLTERLVAELVLCSETPIHVGGRDEGGESDLPIARDGAGSPYISGTSLAGPMRAWFAEAFGALRATEIWGPDVADQDSGPEDHDGGGASYLLVEDAIVCSSGVVELRDGVGIDRVYGSAIEGTKFDREILPRGTLVATRLTLELPKGEPEWKAAFGHLLAALAAGTIQFGAATTRGLGMLRLIESESRIVCQPLGRRAAMLERLRAEACGGPDTLAGTPVSIDALVKAASALQPREPPRIEVEIDWEPEGPLMVKAGYAGIAADSLPLVGHTLNRPVGADLAVALVLPGSALKGALRAHGEMTMHTLLDPTTTVPSDPRRRHRVQLRAVPLARDVFGIAPERKRNAAAGPGVQDAEGARGALVLHDCYADVAVPLALWEEIVFSQDDETLRRHLDAAGLHDIDNAYHVAIDRWTGGSAPDLLFTAVEPHAVAWGKLRMTLHLSRLPLEIWRPATALLLAILRELRDGRLPLGHGINRGCGSVRVCSIALRPRGCAAEVVPDVDDLTLAGQDAWLQRLNAAWQDWLDRAGAAK